MSMKNEDLLHYKIDIKTKNDTNFLELAILLDKPEFLEFLPKIRKKYNFNHLIDLKNYDKTIDSFGIDEYGKFDFSTYKNSKELIDYAIKQTTWTIDIDEKMDLLQLLDMEANILCYIFKRPPYFSGMIKQAILCGSVDGDSFQPTSTTIIEGDTLLSTTASFQLPRVAILISPTSTDLDIKKQVQIARHIYKTEKAVSYYKPRTDKVNKIRAYREWYWLRIAGKSYWEISGFWTDNSAVDSSDSGTDYNRVYKGVAYYKKLLTI